MRLGRLNFGAFPFFFRFDFLRPFHFPSLFEQVNQSIDLGGTYVSGG